MKSSSGDRLGATLFSGSSQQRVSDGSAGGRNKIALKPGRSLMDWIRLTHSGKDLTGVGGKRLDVTPEDLANHAKPEDAWICLKGNVYNVSSYVEFHPGGQDELMRGVGKDATDLFNEVHKWVNFESMLEKCLVGRLKAPPVRYTKDVYFRKCTLTKKCQLNRNTFLFTFTLPEGTVLKVPVGHHIRAKVCVEGVQVIRSYTPVSTSILPRLKCEEIVPLPPTNANEIHLIVKIYDDGIFTPAMNKLQIGDPFLISDPDGSFEANRLLKCQRLLLLAAGTGFTPMVRLVSRFLMEATTDRQVKLMFFNKTENDIFWKDELASLAEIDTRFEIHHVLSEPSDDWPGLRGRIRPRLLENVFPSPEQICGSVARHADLNGEPFDDQNQPIQLLICVCGPKAFTEAALGYLKQLGYNSTDVHAFEG